MSGISRPTDHDKNVMIASMLTHFKPGYGKQLKKMSYNKISILYSMLKPFDAYANSKNRKI